MPQSDGFRKCLAFTTACLVVVWTCGSFATAAAALLYRLVLGVWPDTQLYGLVPEAWLPGAAAVARGEWTDVVWAFVLGRDVLTALLVVPPLLLLPCLLLLRPGHGDGIPMFHGTAKPFAPDQSGRPGPTGLPFPSRRPGRLSYSTKNGT